MTEHLPECPAGYVADLCTTDIDPVLQEPTCNHCVGQGCICICNRLRACEQRVRHEGDVGPNRGGVHHELCGCDDDEPLCEPEDCPYCSCWRLRACEQRVLSLNPVALGVLIAQRARERALDAAREAVAALPARYKVRGDLDTYGPYNAGRMYMKDAALAAIDALKEKP